VSENKQGKVVIWDLPTRVFHWLLVTAFILAWLSYDDNRFMFLHVFAGYAILVLLGFRLLWGIIGTHYARFHTFAHDWRSVTDYLLGLLNGKAMRYLGHNPAGGWAIFAMLVLGLLVSLTGLLVFGGEEGHGPLQGLISYKIGIMSRPVHEFLAWSMLALTVFHVAGVFIESLLHRENLIWPMLTGYKEGAAGVSGVRGHHYLGVSMTVIAIVAALFYFRGYLVETADHLYQPYKGPVMPDNALWRESCSECHYAFHPNLLPARSWRKIFEEQHDHFGDDLDLSKETAAKLLEFHVKNASESELTEFARKILYHTPENETPLRITETHYWQHKHKHINPDYWQHKKVKIKGNCIACHLDADLGTYEDSNMRLPKKETAEANPAPAK